MVDGDRYFRVLGSFFLSLNGGVKLILYDRTGEVVFFSSPKYG
jgi:hypothetical protein